jgi:2-iminobutanoate/2-iminopropanoate deaminase
MIRPIETQEAPHPLGPYSQAVVAGPWIFVSGQLGIDPRTGRLAADDLERQTTQALDNIATILLAADSGWEKVVRVEIFLTDLRDMEVVDALYGERVQGMVQPARQLLQISKLPHKARIAVSCIAFHQ